VTRRRRHVSGRSFPGSLSRISYGEKTYGYPDFYPLTSPELDCRIICFKIAYKFMEVVKDECDKPKLILHFVLKHDEGMEVSFSDKGRVFSVGFT